jgi:hypothetical protein
MTNRRRKPSKPDVNFGIASNAKELLQKVADVNGVTYKSLVETLLVRFIQNIDWNFDGVWMTRYEDIHASNGDCLTIELFRDYALIHFGLSSSCEWGYLAKKAAEETNEELERRTPAAGYAIEAATRL